MVWGGGCREGEAQCQAVGTASPRPLPRQPLPHGPFSGRVARGLGSGAALGKHGGPGAGGPGWGFGLLTCPWLGADFMKCSIKLFFLMCPVMWGAAARPALASDPALGLCSDHTQQWMEI